MRFASVLGFVTSAALAASACNIEHHEGSDSESSCISFCARLSACGAEQADDMDECIDACEDRFDEAEAYQRELCECSDWSSCEDLEQGRCSPEEPEPEPGSSGGASAGGGSAGEGSSSNGCSSTTGGSGGSGGTTADPCSCGEGGASGDGGQSGASGSAGAGGEGGAVPPPAACVRDCDCLITEWCVDGYCSAEPG